MSNYDMEWVDTKHGRKPRREYRRPCGYAVAGVVETEDGRYAARMYDTRIVRHCDSMREAMTWVMGKFKGEDENMTFNRDNVKAMNRRDDGVVVLTCEARQNLLVQLTNEQVKTIVGWYNDANAITVEPEYHEGIMLDTDGLVELHNRLLKELLNNEDAPSSLLEYVLAIRKQFDYENYWKDRRDGLDNL